MNDCNRHYCMICTNTLHCVMIHLVVIPSLTHMFKERTTTNCNDISLCTIEALSLKEFLQGRTLAKENSEGVQLGRDFSMPLLL